MPTGYTQKLYDGEQTFEDFVLRTAPRISHNSFDVEYHAKELNKARIRLSEAQAIPLAAWEAKANEHYQRLLAEWKMRCAAKAEVLKRYNKMKARVLAWTPDLALKELRDLMLDQLQQSIDFDCVTPDAPVKLNTIEYRQQFLSSLEWDVNYHTEALARATKARDEGNAWIRKLYASLDMEVPTTG